MTYNIILLFFTISSILKCQFLNHTQPLYKFTISSICFALLRYIIHVLVLAPAVIFIFHSFWCLSSSSSTALVILGGVQRPQMKVRRCIAMLYFIIVVVLLLSHLHCVIENVTCTIGFTEVIFQQDWNGLLMRCHWAVSLCVLWFHRKLENSGARDVSATRTLS